MSKHGALTAGGHAVARVALAACVHRPTGRPSRTMGQPASRAAAASTRGTPARVTGLGQVTMINSPVIPTFVRSPQHIDRYMLLQTYYLSNWGLLASFAIFCYVGIHYNWLVLLLITGGFAINRLVTQWDRANIPVQIKMK